METLLNYLSQSLTENPLLAYFGVFLGGILSSSSPCVLATIPLVIGYVGGYSEGDRRKALLYSLTFILGLSLTFTVLGTIASVIGGLFGMISRTWYFIVGGIAVAIGLQLVGLYEFNLPTPGHIQPKQRGLVGAFILGLIFGIVSSPCATPILALILTFVATKGEIAYGTSLLFVYALGHCVLIFLAGCALEIVYCLMWKVTPFRNLVSGMVKTCGPLAGVFAVDPEPSLLFLVFLFLWLFFWEIGGQNIPNDWAEIEEDTRLQARTILVRYGAAKASAVVLGSLVFSVGLNLLLFGVSIFRPAFPYLVASFVIGFGLLLSPAYRLYKTKERQDALTLFKRASYYPLACLILVTIRILIGH